MSQRMDKVFDVLLDVKSDIGAFKADIQQIKATNNKIEKNIKESLRNTQEKIDKQSERIKSLEMTKYKLYGFILALSGTAGAFGHKLAGLLKIF